MKLTSNPAPALSRGLDLLRRLANGGPASLETLSQATSWPKSSVSRILQSLELSEAVRRDPVTRQYHPRLQLVPVNTTRQSLIERASVEMDHLCRVTRLTVELYAFRNGGLTMLDRREPVQAEVCVRARIGHIRDLTEIEALSQAVRTWVLSGITQDSLPMHQLWAWNAGRKAKVSAKALNSAIQQTRKRGVGIDLDINEHGVRRYACAIGPDSSSPSMYEGVLALAQVCPPTALDPDPRLSEALIAAASRLNKS